VARSARVVDLGVAAGIAVCPLLPPFCNLFLGSQSGPALRHLACGLDLGHPGVVGLLDLGQLLADVVDRRHACRRRDDGSEDNRVAHSTDFDQALLQKLGYGTNRFHLLGVEGAEQVLTVFLLAIVLDAVRSGALTLFKRYFFLLLFVATTGSVTTSVFEMRCSKCSRFARLARLYTAYILLFPV